MMYKRLDTLFYKFEYGFSGQVSHVEMNME